MNRLLSRQIIRLQRLPNVGPATIIKIVNSDSKEIDFEKPGSIIDLVKQVAPKTGENLNRNVILDAISEADEILNACESLNIEIIGYCDESYPSKYKDIGNSAPVIIYCKGDISLLNSRRKVAIIGTRKISDQGIKAGKYVTKALVDEDFVVVSGLAIGCDTIGHKECLDNGGKTIAILAHGLDMIYPKENKALADRIIENGCLITEYPPYTKFNANYFVARDRLQSGLSHGVLVIETNIKGGTLHTVNFAIKQMRPVA